MIRLKHKVHPIEISWEGTEASFKTAKKVIEEEMSFTGFSNFDAFEDVSEDGEVEDNGYWDNMEESEQEPETVKPTPEPPVKVSPPVSNPNPTEFNLGTEGMKTERQKQVVKDMEKSKHKAKKRQPKKSVKNASFQKFAGNTDKLGKGVKAGTAKG